MDTLVFLQHYWWFLIALLGAVLVFLLFVQGGQGLLPQLARSEAERTALLASLDHKWELTFTTLVVFGAPSSRRFHSSTPSASAAHATCGWRSSSSS